ncbi:hypothetical protein GCM10027589_29250 [Actinocorallia lasiicapitis]
MKRVLVAAAALALLPAALALGDGPSPEVPAPAVTTSPGPVSISAPASARMLIGCAGRPLKDDFHDALDSGASIIVGHVELTGRSNTTDQIFDEMLLTSVRTLAGPKIRSGITAWISGERGPAGPATGGPSGAIWSPDGGILAILWPNGLADPPTRRLSPGLRLAPLVNGQVILSTAGCWSAQGLPSTPFTAPLSEIPGSNSYTRAAETGFTAVPLTTIEPLTR